MKCKKCRYGITHDSSACKKCRYNPEPYLDCEECTLYDLMTKPQCSPDKIKYCKWSGCGGFF